MELAPCNRKRKRPSPLEYQYQRQLRFAQKSEDDLYRLANLVAWTWIPGQDRIECPQIVNYLDPRLMVLDRFPDKPGGVPLHIGLSMYRTTLSPLGRVDYASPANIEMFKDFNYRPHAKAGGLALNSKNEMAFRTALALHRELNLVLEGKVTPVDTFVPPPVLFGFSCHYQPTPEWRPPMHQAVLDTLHPDADTLACLLSPGGHVRRIIESADGFKVISLEQMGNVVNVRVPNWTILQPHTKVGNFVGEGERLAELPRQSYSSIKEVTLTVGNRAIEWLTKRILEEQSEFYTTEEPAFDRRTNAPYMKTSTWRLVPAKFVPSQRGRAMRYYLDFRHHLGRHVHSIDTFGDDRWNVHENQCQIFVRQFERRPAVENLQFFDGDGHDNSTWFADLMTICPKAPWAQHAKMRGVPDEEFSSEVGRQAG